MEINKNSHAIRLVDVGSDDVQYVHSAVAYQLRKHHNWVYLKVIEPVKGLGKVLVFLDLMPR